MRSGPKCSLGGDRRGIMSWLCHAQAPSCHEGIYPQRVQRVLLPVVHTVGPWHHSHGGASGGAGAAGCRRDATVASTRVGVRRSGEDGILAPSIWLRIDLYVDPLQRHSASLIACSSPCTK